MRKFSESLLAISLTILLGLGAAKADFVEGIEDIPLPEGLVQQHNDDISFGNTESRFVEAYFASRKLSCNKVSDFYRNTLPQLGWKFIRAESKRLVFERDMESLQIVCERRSPLLLRITLTSKD